MTKQRIAIIGFAPEPILILDEATNALDQNERNNRKIQQYKKK